MRRIIALLLLLIFILCGCSSNNNFEETYTNIVEYPDATVKENINGYKLQVSSSQTTSSVSNELVYIANTSSKKFHISSCNYAKKMDEVNARIEKDKYILINEGYSPCKVCKP